MQRRHGSTGERSRGSRLAGVSEPICSCVLTLFPSFAQLCAQTFPSVPRLLLVCSSCLNGCPCVPSPTANTKTLTSGRQQTVKPSLVGEQLSGVSQLGVFWVFSGYFAGMQMQCRPAVSRVTELGPRPCWDPRGSSCCPAQGFSHQRRRCHPAQCPAIHTAPGSPP